MAKTLTNFPEALRQIDHLYGKLSFETIIPILRELQYSGHPRGGPSIMSAVANVTDSTFEAEVLKADVPVLVDFWAPWCGPCKAVAPIVEDLSKDFEGKIKVVKLNTDENPKTAQAYHIRGIPSLYLFKSGQVVEQVVGAVPKSKLTSAINKHV